MSTWKIAAALPTSLKQAPVTPLHPTLAALSRPPSLRASLRIFPCTLRAFLCALCVPLWLLTLRATPCSLRAVPGFLYVLCGFRRSLWFSRHKKSP